MLIGKEGCKGSFLGWSWSRHGWNKAQCPHSSAGAQHHPHGSQAQVLGPNPQKKESAMSSGLVSNSDKDGAVWSHLLPTQGVWAQRQTGTPRSRVWGGLRSHHTNAKIKLVLTPAIKLEGVQGSQYHSPGDLRRV